jgi:uncharacterized damage-inducible protein DinB
MSPEATTLERFARRALSGKGSHVETKTLFSGLDWRAAGSKPDGVSHSVYELLEHMSYWQEWVLAWLEGHDPAIPRHASGSWPVAAGPSSRGDWEKVVQRFRRGLGRLERACRGATLSSGRGRKSRLEMLHTIAAHNSYHAGQVAFLRQLLGKWPPPTGGLTW